MGRNKAFVSTTQQDKKTFQILQNQMKRFGFQEVAKEAKLRSYQVVSNYYWGRPVMKVTEDKILKALESLVKKAAGISDTAQNINNIINL